MLVKGLLPFPGSFKGLLRLSGFRIAVDVSSCLDWISPGLRMLG